MLTVTRPGFEEYVAARGGSLLRFAYLLCGDPHLAEDLVQEVLIKAHRRWSAIEADDPEVYVKRALVRTHISWLRRRASSEIAITAVPERSDAGFDDAHASREEVWTMLARLPRSQRAVLVLRYFEDLDDRRIAELVGVSPSTVRTHAQKGLRTLRETLTAAAQEAPSGVGLVEEVRRRVARGAGRRRAVVGGLAAVLVAATISLAVLLLPDRGGEPPAQPTPSPTATSGLMLVPTTVTAPEFPYTFSYLPPRVGPAVVNVKSGLVGVSFGEDGCECPPLEIRISADQWDITGAEQWMSSVTINGAAATLWEYPTGDALVEWQRDGRWLYASQASRRGGERVSVADLLRFAEGLSPGTTVAEPGGLASVVSVPLPADHVISSHDAGSLCSAPTSADDSFPRLCIFVGLPSRVETRGDEITVDGQRAFYDRGGATAWLTVEVSGERRVAVSYQEDLVRRATVTLDDLIAIYHGIVFAR